MTAATVQWTKRSRSAFRKALIRRAKPAWRRCFWTWPFGHQIMSLNGCMVCKWCGKPTGFHSASEFDLIRAAERATGIDLDEGLVDERLIAAWRKS